MDLGIEPRVGVLLDECEAKHQNTFDEIWVGELATEPYSST